MVPYCSLCCRMHPFTAVYPSLVLIGASGTVSLGAVALAEDVRDSVGLSGRGGLVGYIVQ